MKLLRVLFSIIGLLFSDCEFIWVEKLETDVSAIRVQKAA